jgi:hypothetical protein
MNCAQSARPQSRIKYYFSEGMGKAPVGDLRLNVFAVTDKSDSYLDNVAIDKYSQKVGGLC